MIAGVQPTPRLRDVAGCGLATSRTTSREESRATTRGAAACGMLRDGFSSPHGRAPARTRARIREAGAGKHPAASRTSRKRLRDADLGCGMCCGMALSASRTSRIRRGNLAPMTYDRAHWEQLWAKTLREHPDKVAQRPPNAHFIAEVCGLRSGRALDAGCGHGAEERRRHKAPSQSFPQGGDRGDVLAVEHDAPAGHRQEAQDQAPHRRLAAAALAHEAERLALGDVERGVIHRAQDGSRATSAPSIRADRKVPHERLDRQERRAHHWITRSARCSSDGETVMPSARAVLRLITKSMRVGCSTGRSVGLAPLRIRSTYRAARPQPSNTLGP